MGGSKIRCADTHCVVRSLEERVGTSLSGRRGAVEHMCQGECRKYTIISQVNLISKRETIA